MMTIMDGDEAWVGDERWIWGMWWDGWLEEARGGGLGANWRCGGLWELKINDRGSVGVGELRGRAVMFVTDGGGIEYTKLFGLA
jgi:hypothetical protein